MKNVLLKIAKTLGWAIVIAVFVVTMPIWYLPMELYFARKYHGGWLEALRKEQGEE